VEKSVARTKNYKTIYLCALALSFVYLFLPLNAQQPQPQNTLALADEAWANPTQEPDVWLTIFVHGIISIKPHITVSNFMRFLTDNVRDSIYGETVQIMRDDPFFYQTQTMQGRGLHPIDLENHTRGAAASLMANLFEQMEQINPVQRKKNYYYTYGWSGLLSRTARYGDAKEFLQALEHEVEKFRAQGINPKLRLIGYSHGGTIIMKTALVKQRENLNTSVSIDEVLLFGTPIQYETDYLIHDPMFKKVYNFFSRSDRVQRLDFFSCGAFFSDQVFRAHADFDLPDKLIQIELKVIRKICETKKCICITDAQQPLLYNGRRRSRSLRNVSPGHSELWFFGWTALHYRPTFPLYPLPIVAFTPYILNTLKPLEHNFYPDKPIVVTIDPRRDSMIITNKLPCDCQIFKFPFVGMQNMIYFIEQAFSYEPDPAIFNADTYNDHINQALEEAFVTFKARKCKVHDEHLIQYVLE